MRKVIRFLKILLLVMLAVAALIIGFLAFRLYSSYRDENIRMEERRDISGPGSVWEETDTQYVQLPAAEDIVLDEDSGVMFVQGELLVYGAVDSSYQDIEKLAERMDAEIIGYIEAIQLYQLRFRENTTYEQLAEKAKEMQRNRQVEAVSINPVSEMNPDIFVPSDPWDVPMDNAAFGGYEEETTAEWGETEPGGQNWGMEAVRALSAWEYRDEMAEVAVGVIDTPVGGNEDLVVEKQLGYQGTGKHGTHVAGTMAAGFDNEIGVTGMVPKARIYAYGTNGNYYTSGAEYMMAITTLVTTYDVKVINISQNSNRLIGFAADHGNEKALNYLNANAYVAQVGLRRLVDRGWQFVVCMAAGNNNSNVYYKNILATYGFQTKPLWPFQKEYKGGATAKYNNFLNVISDSAVKNRIIVTGSIGMNTRRSDGALYHFSEFSNIGSRVDVAAPGEDIGSTLPGGYGLMSGTSMASPHTAGVAAMVFACNPRLTGSEVRDIICKSAGERFYYDNSGYCRLLDAKAAVETALASRENPVSVLLNEEVPGLDLCFVIDTTGSMDDDIGNAKENMKRIIGEITAKTENYRIALVDYRDFPERSGREEDYPFSLQLDFSSNDDAIIAAVNGLTLGNGGDEEETVFAALYFASQLNWRKAAEKTIIIMGDAPPLDPEPNTGFTYDDVAEALNKSGIGINVADSTYGAIFGNQINKSIAVYSIGIGNDGDSNDFFRKIAEDTDGGYLNVEEASEVSDAIVKSIEQIEVERVSDARIDLGETYARDILKIYRKGDYLFEVPLDESGRVVLKNMPEGSYEWDGRKTVGSFSVKAGEKKTKVTVDRIKKPERNLKLILIVTGSAAGVLLCSLFLVLIVRLKKRINI